MSDRDNAALEAVYAAKDPAALEKAYAGWASAYDRETAELGYCLPFLITSWVARHVPRDAGPLLDAGCGTGLSGPYLAALGYGAVDGLDFSEEMLALARARRCYGNLARATLGDALPFADGAFVAFFSTGVFTEGHAPAQALVELTRITRAGGHAIFTVRDTILDSGGFPGVFDRLTAEGRWRRIEESPPFRAFAVAEPDVMVKAFVFEVL